MNIYTWRLCSCAEVYSIVRGHANILQSSVSFEKWFTLLWLEDLEVYFARFKLACILWNAYACGIDVGGEVLRELMKQGKHQLTVLSRKVGILAIIALLSITCGSQPPYTD